MTLHPAHDIRNPHGARLARHRDAVGGIEPGPVDRPGFLK